MLNVRTFVLDSFVSNSLTITLMLSSIKGGKNAFKSSMSNLETLMWNQW